MKTPLALCIGALALLIAGAAWLRRDTEEPWTSSSARAIAASAPTVKDGATAQASPLDAPHRYPTESSAAEPSPPKLADAQPAALELGERELMIELRKLLSSDPEKVILLASAKNQELPNSPDAPERAWMVVKSLDGLGRFHEAQREARRMVERYPRDRFTLDVERHQLVYPLDQPSREAMQAAAKPHPAR